LVAPISAYRYQDMGLINDVQINGQITLTKPVTHNYDADNSLLVQHWWLVICLAATHQSLCKELGIVFGLMSKRVSQSRRITMMHFIQLKLAIKAQFRNVGHGIH
jgi:hypothetical protein